MNEIKLNAYRGGKLIYEAKGDKSLINLLTNRYNPKTKYSMNAVKIFNDLNMLSNLPPHKLSGKSKMVGPSVVYYNEPKQLADRMKILIGSMAAGNNSPVLKNDLSQINDEMLKVGAIDKTIHEKLYKKIYNVNNKMNVNRVLAFKSLDARKQNPNNKPGNLTTKFIPEMILDENKHIF